MAKGEHVTLELDGHEVRFSNPGKVFFPERGHTKLDLCEYYLEVAEPCIRHLRDRPFSLEPLLDLAERDERGGLGDAPWPPHFRKQRGEPKRVQPSRARKA
jgi:bifunctional non-homologous end joining protein LigD